MNLVEQERQTYESMWAVPAYSEHSPGVQWLPSFIDMTHAEPTKSQYLWPVISKTTLLDAGCGSGKAAHALSLAGFNVSLCDLTDEGLAPEVALLPFYSVVLWSDLAQKIGHYDWVYCCDVLEHIPLPFTMLVVSRLLDVAQQGVFLSISLQPDVFGAWVGKPLHQSLQPFVAWRDQLASIATVVECRDMLTTGLYYVRVRQC